MVHPVEVSLYSYVEYQPVKVPVWKNGSCTLVEEVVPRYFVGYRMLGLSGQASHDRLSELVKQMVRILERGQPEDVQLHLRWRPDPYFREIDGASIQSDLTTALNGHVYAGESELLAKMEPLALPLRLEPAVEVG
jgi:hypothetical protein